MKYSRIEIEQIASIDDYYERMRKLKDYLDICINDARVYTEMDRITDYLSSKKLQEVMKLEAVKAIANFLMESGLIEYDLVKQDFGRAVLVTTLKVVC